MNGGTKVLLGGLALVGIGALVLHSGTANAAEPAQPPALPPANPLGGIVVVPPTGPDVPNPAQPAIVVPPLQIPGLPATPALNIPIPALPALPIPAPMPLPAPAPVPVPAPVLNLPSPAEQPTAVAADTLAMLTQLLGEEHGTNWRISPEPTVKAWQAARGLGADGDFGTGTALALAKEVGTIPIIRGWPKGSYLGDGKLANYQAALRTLALNAADPIKSQLIAAASREQGQGYGTPAKPILNLISLS